MPGPLSRWLAGRSRAAAPLLALAAAIAVTDLVFAMDSIPAIFGLTRDPYLVLTANAFALLGLRQLYFLIGGLLNRLVHLSAGLSAILTFIGVKLLAEALAHSGIRRIGLVPVPHISTGLSLCVIGGVLAIVTVTSVLATRHKPAPGIPAAEAGSAAGGLPPSQRARGGFPGVAPPGQHQLSRPAAARPVPPRGRPARPSESHQ